MHFNHGQSKTIRPAECLIVTVDDIVTVCFIWFSETEPQLPAFVGKEIFIEVHSFHQRKVTEVFRKSTDLAILALLSTWCSHICRFLLYLQHMMAVNMKLDTLVFSKLPKLPLLAFLCNFK